METSQSGSQSIAIGEQSDAKSDAKTVKSSVTATAAGAQKLGADLVFFLCTPQVCSRLTDKLELTLPTK